MKTLIPIAAAALALAACAQERPLSASPPASTPLPGAQAPGLDDSSRTAISEPAASGPRSYNSDNRPTASRSGLNSDPDNPNGAPGTAPRTGM